jgi:hypothetical protein
MAMDKFTLTDGTEVSMESVPSTNISAVGYDETTGTLIVRFNNGSTYRYDQVPAHEHEGLLKAPSAGKYFNGQIRPKYFGVVVE